MEYSTVSDRKDTKLLKAIHNKMGRMVELVETVSDRKDTKLLKAIHNISTPRAMTLCTVSDRKDTKLLKAIHNSEPIGNLFNSFAVLVMAARMDFRLLSIPC